MDLSPVEHLWDVVEWETRRMNVKLTNLQKLCDAILSTWTGITIECLWKSMPQKTGYLTAEALPTFNTVFLSNCSVSVCWVCRPQVAFCQGHADEIGKTYRHILSLIATPPGNFLRKPCYRFDANHWTPLPIMKYGFHIFSCRQVLHSHIIRHCTRAVQWWYPWNSVNSICIHLQVDLIIGFTTVTLLSHLHSTHVAAFSTFRWCLTA